MNKKYFMFSAGERMRGLRELAGLSRRKFSMVVGIKPKRLENIENGWQRMHDEDFQKVCSVFPEFSRWISYEGPLDPKPMELKVADSAQKAAVYLVNRNPELLEGSDLTFEEWQQRHENILNELQEAEAQQAAAALQEGEEIPEVKPKSKARAKRAKALAEAQAKATDSEPT
ncbi:hypothetical protein BZL41_10655 [Pseudomonas sp. PIC25]|uniref:helix-turn-helix domain-containing protein n=1 Tax=Pseudomonas sp. PIC25 TaxID=1958773 RepID=UPI000BABDDAC|nr:helix-turn-helix transcriptional regulator [Pseudomonas sp. PIC25]PAU64069.1 hypothetical protein BZL41_10655 [Pseudomonas sp. PIC25]